MKFDDTYKLCYVSKNAAYFTRLPLDKQWGDDWDDYPYDTQAEGPYDGEMENQIKKIMYFSDTLQTPAEIWWNSSYSVKDINNGAVPWLQQRFEENPVIIKAGCDINTFCDLVKKAGGEIFINLDDIPLKDYDLLSMDESLQDSIPFVEAYDQNGKFIDRTKSPTVLLHFFKKLEKMGAKGYYIKFEKSNQTYDIDDTYTVPSIIMARLNGEWIEN